MRPAERFAMCSIPRQQGTTLLPILQKVGVGVSLTIAAHLVAMMGDDIWVESAGPGTGSTFHFTTRFGVQPMSVLQSLQVPVAVSDLADFNHAPASFLQ